MTISKSTEKLSPEQSGWGWKALIVACILSFIFMLFFYLAISNDPEYMPSHKQAYTQQHVFKSAPVMSHQPLSDHIDTSHKQMDESMHVQHAQ
ncbi:hypothetical protein [Acinetobacter silvestris]|uniref:hypothetical protein n=1 Tax=Acinetobacter silvestris TaxID=1977882 RepID=UPI001BB464E6|nr:hypothetical protein [Acinetobacter silvestris]